MCENDKGYPKAHPTGSLRCSQLAAFTQYPKGTMTRYRSNMSSLHPLIAPLLDEL